MPPVCHLTLRAAVRATTRPRASPFPCSLFPVCLTCLTRSLTAGPKTTIAIAHEEQLPIGLTSDMVSEVEEVGEICRDEGGEKIDAFGAGHGQEVHWWPNVFRGYVWDGQDDS